MGVAGAAAAAAAAAVAVERTLSEPQEGYIFYAGASLAGAGYCRQCRRRPAILPLQLWQGCQVCVQKIFRPTTSKSSPILRLLNSHWATSVVRTRVGVANVGDSLSRLSSPQHRIYNLLGEPAKMTSRGSDTVGWGVRKSIRPVKIE